MCLVPFEFSDVGNATTRSGTPSFSMSSFRR